MQEPMTIGSFQMTYIWHKLVVSFIQHHVFLDLKSWTLYQKDFLCLAVIDISRASTNGRTNKRIWMSWEKKIQHVWSILRHEPMGSWLRERSGWKIYDLSFWNTSEPKLKAAYKVFAETTTKYICIVDGVLIIVTPVLWKGRQLW